MKKPVLRSVLRSFCITSAVLCLLLLSAFAYLFWLFYPDRQLTAACEQLSCGMSRGEVEEIFGRPPDYVCYWSDHEILYYWPSRPGYKSHGRNLINRLPVEVQDKKKIPFVYNARQIMIKPGGKVDAYTWCGETMTITTQDGLFRGTNVAEIPDRKPPA